MAFEQKNLLRFIIETTGEVVPAMPDEEEFSVQQIRNHVAGNPEILCETCDGFLLFRNRDAGAQGLPLNALCHFRLHEIRTAALPGVWPRVSRAPGPRADLLAQNTPQQHES